MHSFFYEL